MTSPLQPEAPGIQSIRSAAGSSLRGTRRSTSCRRLPCVSSTSILQQQQAAGGWAPAGCEAKHMHAASPVQRPAAALGGLDHPRSLPEPPHLTAHLSNTV